MSRIDELKLRLNELGMSPKRSLGQNFLIDGNIINHIIKQAKVFKASKVIEVGPGLGALTEELLKLNLSLKAIELDQKVSQYWRERNVEVIEADALRLDWQNLNLPAETLLVSNLPYQISSSLVIKLSAGPEQLTYMILMFQKEVAQRIAAKCRSKEYGLLSVIAQTYWQVHTVCDVSPRCFYPPPNVASRVLHFTRKPADFSKYEKFLEFVKQAFAQRRKLLVKNIRSLLQKCGYSEDRLIQDLIDMNLTGKARAEELNPEQFFGLFKKINGF